MLARNVLIFHLGALGDFVLTWPLALAVGRLFPQSRVFYVTHSEKGALAEKVLGVESIDIESGWHHLYGDTQQLPERARRLLDGSHAVFSFISSPEDDWSRNAAELAPRADLCVLQPNPPANYRRHAPEYLVQQLAVWPVIQEGARQMLRVMGERGLGYCGAPQGPIVIHPGSGSAGKCWPAEKYLELARRLRRGGHGVRVCLGPVELERWPQAQARAFEEVTEVVRPASCLELLHQLAGARAFIGNDSGPAHLAGILGLPTFVLFGPTSPAVWRPIGPGVRVLNRSPIEAMGVDAVYHWVKPSHLQLARGA